MITPEATLDIHEAQVAKLQGAVEQADHVTVEFGTGGSPVFQTVMGRRIFDEADLYIGVNIDSRQHKLLSSKLGKRPGFAVLSELQEGALLPVPLADESVDTAFMGNVLGEPDNHNIMHDFKDADGVYHGNSSIEAKMVTVAEARRLLKPDGKLVILETNTPYNGFKSEGPPYAKVVTLLEASGFITVEALDMQDPTWEEAVAPYSLPLLWWSRRSYMVTARKTL